jgi:hypothetical protein
MTEMSLNQRGDSLVDSPLVRNQRHKQEPAANQHITGSVRVYVGADGADARRARAMHLEAAESPQITALCFYSRHSSSVDLAVHQ